MKITDTVMGPAWAAACAIAMVACGGDDHPMPSAAYAGPAPARYSAGSSGSSDAGSTGPQLVDVDTNQTLSEPGGQGVGVYVEYKAGGHWHVWWTCDTALTGLTCSFQVGVSVATGAITNLTSQGFEAGDGLTQGSSTGFVATTTTTTGIEGVTFDASPGATITLDAQVDGQRQIEGQSFLFFVQNGQPNGNYMGSVADPLMLEPTSP